MDVDSAPEPIPTSTITTLINLSSTYSLYVPLILNPYHLSTQSYYSSERSRIITTMAPRTYFVHVVKRVREEKERLENVIGKGRSWGDVLGIIDAELIKSQVDNFQYLGAGE